MNKLFLMMGAPGSGKSTWIHKHLEDGDKYISRDEIRFSMLSEEDDYFDKEPTVFNKFIKLINEGLEDGFDVYADASHLNAASRAKVIRRIKYDVEINVIYLNTSLKECYKRNEDRVGRSHVPNTIIKDMFNRIQLPTKEEGISKLYIINENNSITLRNLKEM
jgi:predicted kinase